MSDWKGKCLVRFSDAERAGAFADAVLCDSNTGFDVQTADFHVFVTGPLLKLADLLKRRTDFVCYTLQGTQSSSRPIEDEWCEIVKAAAAKALGQQ